MKKSHNFYLRFGWMAVAVLSMGLWFSGHATERRRLLQTGSGYVRLLDHPDRIQVSKSPVLSIPRHELEKHPLVKFLMAHQPMGMTERKHHFLHIRATMKEVHPWRFGRTVRDAIYAPPPTRFFIKMKIPPGAHLKTAVAVLNRVNRRFHAGTGFIINVWRPGDRRPRTVLKIALRPGRVIRHRRWIPVDVDLSAYAGETVTIVFMTVPSTIRTRRILHAVWANPVIVWPVNRKARPNVLLISLDTLRADRLSVYGHRHRTSPHIDELARRGVLFENVIAAAPFTLASHMSIMTGCYPSFHHTNLVKTDRLPDSITTLAEILYRQGYRTMAITGGGQVSADYGFGRGFESYTEFTLKEDDLPAKLRMLEPWLRENGNRPFFVFLHTYKIHAPYRPKPEFLKVFESSYHGTVDGELATLRQINKQRLTLTPADVAHLEALYDAEIREVDEALGKLFDFLRKTGLNENTLVVLTSDHGEEFGEHGLWGMHSHTLYDELLKVPLIFVLPGKLPQGKRVRNLVSAIDILPTILDLVGVTPNNAYQGHSLIPLMSGSVVPSRYHTVLSERIADDGLIMRAVRTMTAKYIVIDRKGMSRRIQFYRLLDDPKEQHPTWVPPSLLGRFQARIRWLEKGFLEKPRLRRRALSRETLETLRSLGYIQ